MTNPLRPVQVTSCSHFSSFVKEERLRKLLPQMFITGVSQSELSKVESGRVNPSLEIVLKIVEELGFKLVLVTCRT